MQTNPRASEESWHKFYCLPEVVDLNRQLAEGLIHPLEYAYKVQEIGYREGLLVNA